MNDDQKKVINYYQNFESRLGYTYLTWDTKHFGYYPSRESPISEKEAQLLMIDLIAEKLDLKSNNKVLDAGCGRGTVACYLAQKHNAHIIGIDLVEFELKMAKARARKLHLEKNVEFYLRDYSHTEFKDSSFDKVFTLETLVHSPDFHTTLREFHRILKPAGLVVLFEYTLSPPEDFNPYDKNVIDIINTGSAMMSLPKMRHSTFVKDIEKAGFKVIADEDITTHTEPSLRRFRNYAKFPYMIIKLLNLQKHFINTTAGVEFYRIAQKGLVKYRVFVAKKI